MAWTQEDLDAIETAIASGAEEVQFRDRRIRRRSVADLIRIRQEIKQELTTVAGTPVTRQVRMYTSDDK